MQSQFLLLVEKVLACRWVFWSFFVLKNVERDTGLFNS